jgi:hypothetical protein
VNLALHQRAAAKYGVYVCAEAECGVMVGLEETAVEGRMSGRLPLSARRGDALTYTSQFMSLAYKHCQLAQINAFVSNLDIPFSARQLLVLGVPAAVMRSGTKDILRA